MSRWFICPVVALLLLSAGQANAAPQYDSAQEGPVQWSWPRGHEAAVAPLRAMVATRWQEVVADLGVEVDPTLQIHVARNAREMAALVPPQLTPPDYATGVAYPAQGLILLALSAPNTWEPPDIETVLIHELSHVALHRATRGHPIPKWFNEGLAIHQSQAMRLARVRSLLRGALQHELLPLSRLSSGFPSRAYDVNIAYAQSADVVNFLRRDDWRSQRFRALIQSLRDGEPFESALTAAYGWTLPSFEREWRESLRTRYRILPLLLGGTTLWSLMSILLVVAWRRRRREASHKLAKMAAEEAREDHMREALQTPESTITRSEIPRVRHEGENHTLH